MQIRFSQENLGSDAAVAEAVALIDANFNVEYGTVFARTDSFLNGEAEPGVRTEETNLGDLVAGAMVWSAKQTIKEWDVDDDHVDTDTYVDLAIMDYIHLSLGNVITEAMYGTVRGDHTILVE